MRIGLAIMLLLEPGVKRELEKKVPTQAENTGPSQWRGEVSHSQRCADTTLQLHLLTPAAESRITEYGADREVRTRGNAFQSHGIREGPWASFSSTVLKPVIHVQALFAVFVISLYHLQYSLLLPFLIISFFLLK